MKKMKMEINLQKHPPIFNSKEKMLEIVGVFKNTLRTHDDLEIILWRGKNESLRRLRNEVYNENFTLI